MPNALKAASGEATTAGATILTAPSGATLTVIGCRAANKDGSDDHTIEFRIDGTLINAEDTPLPIGSAIDIMAGSKIVMPADSVLTATADADSAVDVYVSYLEQT